MQKETFSAKSFSRERLKESEQKETQGKEAIYIFLKK